MGKIYTFTRKQLKSVNASVFGVGDMVNVGAYTIHIEYKTASDIPLYSWVEHTRTFKSLDCTPGVRGGRPYYIDDFLHR